MERLQSMVNDLKQKSDSLPGAMDPETAREMLLLSDRIASTLQGYLFKHIRTDSGR